MKKFVIKPKRIYLHTAAFRGPANEEIITKWHLARGFDDIGYHFVVVGSKYDNTSGIQTGRSLDYIGAHVSGDNCRSIGICVTGHGDFDEWTETQMGLLIPLVRDLMFKYTIEIKNVLGHREAPLRPNKTCPGKKIDMKEIRKHILTS